MTIDEAISALISEEGWKRELKQFGRADAIKLGIEALKRIKRQRGDMLPHEINLLPGETK